MEDKILKLLDEHNLTTAKDAIIEYEERIKIEKNEYTRCRMIDRLNTYKKIYSEHTEYTKGDIQEKAQQDIKLSVGLPSSLKLEISDEKTNYIFDSEFLKHVYKSDYTFKEISGLIFSEVVIFDSRNLIVGYFEAEQSVYINRVSDTIVICKAKQIRLLDSTNLTLYVDVSCGITLERSSNIKIYSLNPTDNYIKINDFSNPFGCTNCKVMSNDNKSILL